MNECHWKSVFEISCEVAPDVWVNARSLPCIRVPEARRQDEKFCVTQRYAEMPTFEELAHVGERTIQSPPDPTRGQPKIVQCP